MLGAGTLPVQAQFGPPSPERQAAIAKQLALEEATPKLQITEEVLPLTIPDHTIGETEGVSMNSKGHLFVYSRTGTGGSSRGGTAAELFEFDQNMKFVKLWGPDNYAASFAHSVRVDKYDNVWMVDEGSGMIVKFDPNGMVKMTLGRKPEAIDYLERYVERGEKVTERYPVGNDGHIQPGDRRRVGSAGQYVRQRRLRQLARRQDREGRHLGEDRWERTVPATISSTRRTASPRTRRATFMSPTAATSASRSMTPI